MQENPLRNVSIVHPVYNFCVVRRDLFRKIALLVGFSGYLIYYLATMRSLQKGIGFISLWLLLFAMNGFFLLRNQVLAKSPGIPYVTYYGLNLPYHDELKSHINTLMIHDSITNRIIAQCGLKLTVTTLTTQPNYQDVMRKIYEAMEHFMVTVQVRMHREGHTHIQIQSYCIFLEKHTSPFHFRRLCKDMVASFHDLFAIVQVNFNHYKFEMLADEEFLSSLFGPMGLSPKDVQISQPTIRGLCSLCSKIHFILVLLNITGLVVGLFAFHADFIAWTWMGILIGISFGLLISDFSFLLHRKMLSLLDIWGKNRMITKKMPSPTSVIWTPVSNYYHFSQQFCLSQFNQNFHFSPTKFYRNLLFEYFNHERNPEGDFDLTIQFHSSRILPLFLENFEEDFIPEFLEKLFSNPRTQSYYERNQAGFWQIYMSFQFTQHFPAPVAEEYLSIDYLPIFQQKAALFQRLIGLHFPTCSPIPDQRLIQFHFMRYYPHRFKTLIPTFLTSGVIWSNFWEIPPEIHKQLLSQYAGEFSTPLLNDEITFGRTINFENNSLECQAGISLADLPHHVLIAGETPKEINSALNMITFSILTSYSLRPHQMWFLFDLDHDLDSLIRMLNLSPLGSHMRYYEIGKNFGIDLLQLPLQLGGMYELTYYRKLVHIFEVVFGLKEKECGVLQSVLNNLETYPHTIGQVCTDIGNAYASYKGKYYELVLYGVMSLLQKHDLNQILSTQWAKSIEFFDMKSDSPQIFIFNLQQIPTMQLKQLVLLTLFLQLQTTLSLSEFDQIEHGYVLPQIDLWKKVEHDCLLDYIANSIVIASTAKLGLLTPELLQMFRNYFIFRLQHENAVTLAGQILHLDSHFTNIYAHNRRSSSYQYQVLGALRANQCLIKRPAHAFPYPFQVDCLPKIPPLPEMEVKEDSEKDLQEDIPVKNDTWLEMDFQRNALFVEKIALVLQDWTETLTNIKCLSRVQMLEDLRKAFERYFNEQKRTSDQRVKFCDDRFQELQLYNYIESKTEINEKMETGGFTLTEKAKDALTQQKEKNEPQTKKSDPLETEITPETPEIEKTGETPKESIPEVNTICSPKEEPKSEAPQMEEPKINSPAPTTFVPSAEEMPMIPVPKKSEFKTALETALFTTYPMFRNGDFQNAYTHLRTQFENVEMRYNTLLVSDADLQQHFTRNFHLLISIESSATHDFPKMLPLMQDYVAAI